MALVSGDKLGPYEIIAPIGKGGMGEVYRARDTRLKRDVAIKVSAERFTERFEHEAQAIAALNHPNICQIYDVGPDYIVMEYVEGSPLQGPLPQEEAMKLAIQIANALEEAHAKRILHRDLKPGNILITKKGAAKLLDFGLAKLMTAEGDQTQTAAVVGTPAYMSPEQAEGKTLDERSDIFSFGAVLYELLSGRRAFESLAGVLRDRPLSLNVPGSEIAMRCLAKQPHERFQTISEVKAALERTSTRGSPQQPSIAVLPFANMSRDADDEYFSDGLTEEIINALTQVAGLKVIARTSAFAFKGKNEDIRKIAETLGVTNVLEGSVRRAGNRLRITAQLIHAADGSHLWSERYDREMTDVFAVQDAIAQAITTALSLRLSVSSTRQRYQPNLPAYEAYLKARHYWAKLTPEALARSKEYYEQAIALDPGFALAHIGLADYFLLMTAGLGLLPAHETMPLVRAGAKKALEIDPSLPDGHAMLGIVAGIYDNNWKQAERLFRLALGQGPVSPQVHHWHGWFFLFPIGKTNEAVGEIERAVQEDPLNFVYRVCLALCLAASGRYDDARRQCHQILDFDKNYAFAYWMLALSKALQAAFADALPFAETAYSLMPWNPTMIAAFAAILRANGDISRAEEILRPLRNAPESYGAPAGLCGFHLLFGEIDQAAHWDQKAFEQRDAMRFTWLPIFPSLRSSAKLANMMDLPGSA